MALVMRTETQTAVIANGASLSSAVALGAKNLIAIVFPAAWTAASVTFQASVDGTTFVDIYDSSAELVVASAAAG